MILSARGVGACALLLFAHASIAAERGFYFGVGGGEAQYEFERAPRLVIVGPPPGSLPVPPPVFRPPFPFPPGPISSVIAVRADPVWIPGDDDTGTALGATVGYQINRYVAAELGYLDLGKLEASDQLLSFGGGNTITFDRKLETSGPTLSLLGMLPLADAWDVYLRAGIMFADTKVTNGLGPTSESATFGSDAPLWGGGVRFNWGEHWSARLDYQYVDGVGDNPDVGEAEIEVITLGILYRL
jgi:opacity protein-like surface antigen